MKKQWKSTKDKVKNEKTSDDLQEWVDGGGQLTTLGEVSEIMQKVIKEVRKYEKRIRK